MSEPGDWKPMRYGEAEPWRELLNGITRKLEAELPLRSIGFSANVARGLRDIAEWVEGCVDIKLGEGTGDE